MLMRSPGRQWRRLVLLTLLLTVQRNTSAVELWSDEEGHHGELTIAGKATFLASDAPNDPVLFPDEHSETSLACSVEKLREFPC
jgi:hypothetical protein